MNATHISFYLKAYRIHIFIEALRGIENPHRICFMLSKDGRSLAMLPYEKRDFKSHEISRKVYQGGRSFEISSYRLCSMLAELHSWNKERSYRAPGIIDVERRLVLFDLTNAKTIGKGRDVSFHHS